VSPLEHALLTNVSKLRDDVIVGRYCSAEKLQDKTEYGLTTTSLISSVSYFNLGVVDLFGGAKLKKNRGDGTEF